MKNRIGQLVLSTGLMLAIFLGNSVQAQNSETNDRAFLWSADQQELEWGACPEFMPEDCQIALLQGDPAKPNADIFFKLQPKTTAPNHWHHSAERMVLISGELEVQYEGQEAEVMKAGTYGYGPAERPHEATCISDKPCVLFVAFEEPIDAFAVKQ